MPHGGLVDANMEAAGASGRYRADVRAFARRRRFPMPRLASRASVSGPISATGIPT